MRVLLIFLLFLTVINCSTKEKAKNPISPVEQNDLIAVLDTIWFTEQEPIRIRDSIGRIFGFESKEFQKQQEICNKNHEINEKRVVEILKNHGWPSTNEIGEQGSITICNVIQHSDIKIRLKYLPMMRDAVRKKNLHPRLLARAEDRIATDQGQLQIYGGQIKYYPDTKSFNVWPIVDPENVDKRRLEIGLDSIAKFLNNRRKPIVWNLEEQIRRTEEFVKNNQLDKK